MSGSKFLLDTNFVIGLLKGNEQIQNILCDRTVAIDACAYSFITRIELLGFPAITESEIQGITKLLSMLQYLPMNQEIEDSTIHIRRHYKLKIPDAIIAATAKVNRLELLTLDQQLAHHMAAIMD
ncbi:MAG: type II toxin-antitoxin system VapC family toxin [Cyanobacteria bacterium]|nr:type II toxin-antitoxin system VapC family toxin [Cyanobacteriota bacterium]MDA0867510.1 type II toxin-antitoxin system VapC family toxin [Cyanobacteriota bacterium]